MPSSPPPPKQPVIDWAAIRDRIDLARVATALLGPAAKRQGRRLLWPCPFHDDRNPSMEVDPKRGAWKCWPCNLGGDAPALVMQRNGVAFPEAVRIVAELSGIVGTSGPRRAGTSPSPRPTAAIRPEKPASPPPERSSGLPAEEASSLMTEATKRLWAPEGTEALAYLHGRGLIDETIKAARLGLVKSASIPTREGDRCYIARGIVVPWFEGDRLALVKIRQPEGTKPKYAEAFRDRPGIFPGPAVIEPGCPLVIVEGEFDALLLGQELRDLAAVITLGSASSKPNPSLLGLMLAAAPWFLALDGDEAGDKAASGWPARAICVRPPGPNKDWTEAHQYGVRGRK
jgi:DNA primase